MEGCDGPVLQLYVGLDNGHGEVERRAVVRWFSNCVHIVVVCVLQVLLAGLTRGSVLPVYKVGLVGGVAGVPPLHPPLGVAPGPLTGK